MPKPSSDPCWSPNDYGMVGGRDTENDESYRYRINLHIRSRHTANENALRFELLQIHGIQDIVFERKAGTFNAYVYAITPVASASLLETVQTRITDVVAYPLTGVALTPDLLRISLTTCGRGRAPRAVHARDVHFHRRKVY